MTHTQEWASPAVKVQRAGIRIGVSRLLVQFVNQVRAIRRQALFVVRPGHSLDHGLPLFRAEEAVPRRNRRRPRRLRFLPGSWLGCLGRRLRFLTRNPLACLWVLWRGLRLCTGSLFARLRTLLRCLCFLSGSRLRRLWGRLRCALVPRSLRLQALDLFREGERHLAQQRRAHPQREKESFAYAPSPFSHPPSLDECFEPRAVPAAYPLLPLRTAPKTASRQARSASSLAQEELLQTSEPEWQYQKLFRRRPSQS